MTRHSVPEIADRLAAHMRDKTRDTGERAKTRLVAEYTDPRRYQREIEGLFRSLPLVVAHSSQLRTPGDFVAHDRLGPPILVARTASGALAAVLNVCPHRNARVEPESCGHRTSFKCPYHAWMFDLDGRVLNIPDAAAFDGLDRDTLSLRRIAVAEGHGLVFVRLSGTEPIDVDGYLGDFVPELETYGLADHTYFDDRLVSLDCNWKIMAEGSLETYHFNGVHPTTIAPHFASMAGVHDFFGHHQRFVVANRKLPEILRDGKDPRPFVLPTLHIFPNTWLTFPHDHMMMTQVFPQGVGKCLFLNALFVRGRGLDAIDRGYWEKALDLTQGVNDEDFVVVQSIQKNYDTAPAHHVVHGRYEAGLSRFHESLDAILGPYGNA